MIVGRARASATRAIARARPFNPAHVSGLYAWYRASTGATLGTTPLATGTTPPAVTIAATDATQPTASALRIEITTTGARGTADFRWSVNDGATFEASGVLTAATVALASANVTVTFPLGTYTSDNVYRATCSQWNDRTSNALNLSQATVARQPVRQGRDTTLNNRPAMLFDASNDSIAAASAADWKLIHDGTGCTVIIALRVVTLPSAADGYVLDTGDLTGPGIYWVVSTTGLLQTLVMNASGLGGILLNSQVAGAIVAGTSYVLTYSYLEGASPEFVIRKNGTQIDSATSAVAASAANPLRAATFGGVVGVNPLNAAYADIAVYNRQLTAAQMSDVERWMGREYGITIA